MNQTIVDDIAEQLNRVNEIPEVEKIIAESKSTNFPINENLKNFNVEYLNAEWAKIKSAAAKDYTTYRSEYRVAKTLIHQRNQIIYQLRISNINDVNVVNVDAVLEKFVELSKLLTSMSKSIGEVFETEKTISNLAAEFDNSWKQ